MKTAKLAKILKALSNQKRLELYLEVARHSERDFEAKENECFVCDIMESLKIGAPTVSHHLKELSNADLITTERRGKFLVAKAKKGTLREAQKVLSIVDSSL
ncbi:MAG: metalloregulator ArsR/SmtB family transcription factor [Desulfobacterales bacterium]|nr:metalloregulator ArsR/SmtB family transcription factor [Desulfobacterales bacterium]